MDSTEAIRREMVADINNQPHTREEFKELGVKVWDTSELTKEFEVIGFMAPFCVAKRKDTGARGTFMFQDTPRLYFEWKEA